MNELQKANELKEKLKDLRAEIIEIKNNHSFSVDDRIHGVFIINCKIDELLKQAKANLEGLEEEGCRKLVYGTKNDKLFRVKRECAYSYRCPDCQAAKEVYEGMLR